jgi:hypothetical protein
MTAKGIVIPDAIAAMNVDAWNRNAVCASAVENGMIMYFSAKSTTAQQEEVWTAARPASGAGLVNLWMAYEPELVVTNAQYKGLDPDVRNFEVAIGKIFTVFFPRIGDIITVNEEAITGSKATGDYAVATASSWRLNWAASGSVSGLVFQHIGTTTISIADGSIGTQRIVAYQLECIAVA